MKRFIAVVILCVPVGCSKNDDINKSVIEQQRINLDTLKQNQETLDKIREREKELLQLDKRSEAAIKEIADKHKQLAEKEANLLRKAQELEAAIATNKSVLTKQQETLRDISKQNAIATRRAERAETRTPFVEMLAQNTANALDGVFPSDMILPRLGSANYVDEMRKARMIAKEYHYNQCLGLIRDSGVMEIDADDVFDVKAKELMIRYVERNGYTPNRSRESIEKVNRIKAVRLKKSE